MISVIIPSYNHEKYIAKAIDSVLEQSYTNLELIIIDDGSKDNSEHIIKSYTDKRVIAVFQENRGAHAAINRGMQLAKGDYITILNSDDYFDINRFQECMNIFNNNQNIDFISTWINVVDDNNQPIGLKKAWQNMEPWDISNKSLTFIKTGNYILNALMSNFVSTTSNMVFKRNVYEKIGGMRNLRFTHDWDYLLRVCETFTPYNLEKPLVNYRIHGNNTISSHRKWMLFEICWIFASNIDRFSEQILQKVNEESLIDNIDIMLNSFNFQDNEHIVRVLYWQFSVLKQKGIINPEEIYLSSENLRNKMIQYIQE